MSYLEKLFFFLFPMAMLKGTPWEDLWNQQEKAEFQFIAKAFFTITLIGYVLHYYTVDRAEGLAPSELWFNYRFGMAAISLICLSFYWHAGAFESAGKMYRVPAIIAGAFFCYFQTRTVIWYPQVPYLYSFGFVFVCVIILRTSILKSSLVALGYFALIFSSLLEAKLSPAMAFSASFFTLSGIIFARTKYTSDLKYFLVTQKSIQQQRKFIEANIEFTNQIRAFLPAEISRRLMDFIQDKRMSVVQAIDEVLRPRNTKIVCLFSDIRGFTKRSEDLEGFVTKAVFPNVKASTVAIENHHGISRKIGDLIFAYYDFPDFTKSVTMAVRSAMELSRINAEMNELLPEDINIRRFILLSCGEAVVGNLSGYDSAIEITAIGSPVNYLSRLDELTKDPKMKAILEVGDVLMSSDMAQAVKSLMPEVGLNEINLSQLGVAIRDFESVQSVYIYRYLSGSAAANQTEQKRAS